MNLKIAPGTIWSRTITLGILLLSQSNAKFIPGSNSEIFIGRRRLNADNKIEPTQNGPVDSEFTRRDVEIGLEGQALVRSWLGKRSCISGYFGCGIGCCPVSRDCCVSFSCIPVDSNCCRDGTYCTDGNTCVIVQGLMKCCTNLSCTAHFTPSTGAPTTATVVSTVVSTKVTTLPPTPTTVTTNSPTTVGTTVTAVSITTTTPTTSTPAPLPPSPTTVVTTERPTTIVVTSITSLSVPSNTPTSSATSVIPTPLTSTKVLTSTESIKVLTSTGPTKVLTSTETTIISPVTVPSSPTTNQPSTAQNTITSVVIVPSSTDGGGPGQGGNLGATVTPSYSGTATAINQDPAPTTAPKHGMPLGDRIALGCGIGVGVPAAIAGIWACVFGPLRRRH